MKKFAQVIPLIMLILVGCGRSPDFHAQNVVTTATSELTYMPTLNVSQTPTSTVSPTNTAIVLPTLDEREKRNISCPNLLTTAVVICRAGGELLQVNRCGRMSAFTLLIWGLNLHKDRTLPNLIWEVLLYFP